jgi:hypothetical protein
MNTAFCRPYLRTKTERWNKREDDGEKNVKTGAQKLYEDCMRCSPQYIQYEDEKGDAVVARTPRTSKNYAEVLRGLLPEEWQLKEHIRNLFLPLVSAEDALLYPGLPRDLPMAGRVAIGKAVIFDLALRRLSSMGRVFDSKDNQRWLRRRKKRAP